MYQQAQNIAFLISVPFSLMDVPVEDARTLHDHSTIHLDVVQAQADFH
jgi:hypothetical protein